MDNKEKINGLLKRSEQLEACKQNFLSVAQEIADYFRPIRSDMIGTKIEGDKNQFSRIQDSFPILAAETLASIFNGVITNRSVKWFNLSTINQELTEDNEVSEWLTEATEIMWNKLYNPLSNFEQAHQESLKDLVTFGSIATKIEEGKGFILNYLPLHFKNFLIAENDEGKVDTIVLKSTMEAKQIVSKWDNIGEIHETIREAFEKDPYKKFDIQLHIYPRQNRDKAKIDKLNKAYEGVWVDVKNKVIIEEIGWDVMPIAIGRSEKAIGEVYGTSRAMMALPDAKQLNLIWKQYVDSVELVLRPPLTLNADFEGRINLSPGALNKAKQNASYAGRAAIEPILTVGNINGTLDLVQEKVARLREIFFLDKLKIMDNPNATATQVMELRAESFRIMSSIATSMQEYLDGLLARTFDILFRKSFAVNDLDGGQSSFTPLPDAIFPELPDKLKEAPDLKVNFINPINQAQQITELNSIDVLIQTTLTLAQASPGVMDVVNFDNVLRKKTSILNIDPELVNDKESVDQMRQARQEAQQKQQDLEQAQLQSSAAKNYKDAGVEL